ncbi:C6 zinc finger domain protein [Colletotrichum truncatum]|uniref:C6 zinc finger domain protein n=1 Tax=Colletotrichum truncatum TaxID=5467 RepID=A0ACC3YW43_COLTU|nr:C6 zinc finger domain protein [Colletotrichum truncatum]KAF6791109.1 C6 zinc finger domain protein [Colletotrichum truncatum]
MARKGSRKVRTGCFTCKTRKVKCDETKPACLRCSNTGRQCDGYPAPPRSELRPFRPKTIAMFPGVASQAEGRALQFFCEMAGPNLPGSIEPFFWTHIVLQFSRFEPAVRHSLVAISSLYEDVTKAKVGPSSLKGQRLRDNSLALTHYNSAIRELMGLKNQEVVLLVCVLFICIELLQSNSEAALRHCAHGNAIFKFSETASYHWVKEWLMPLFRRLNALQYFFARKEDSMPDLSISAYETPVWFSNFKEAELMIDDIFNQSFQLIRLGSHYRIGNMRHKKPTEDLLAEQKRVTGLLDLWFVLFKNLDTRPKSAKDAITGIPRIFALARYRICQIWSGMAFNPSEMGYDAYENDFRLMVSQLSEAANGRMKSSSRNNFEFEMGFIAPVSFIVMKCRFLDLRLEALRCLKVLAAPREALWQKDGMYALAKRIVEIEHGLSLDCDGRPFPGVEPSTPRLPPDEMRVVHFVTEFLQGRHNNFYGHEVRGRKVVFIMSGPGDRMVFRPDVLDEEQVPLSAWSPEITQAEILR